MMVEGFILILAQFELGSLLIVTMAFVDHQLLICIFMGILSNNIKEFAIATQLMFRNHHVDQQYLVGCCIAALAGTLRGGAGCL